MITIYTSPTCHVCKELKTFLDSKKIKYTDKEVTNPANAKKAIAISGGMSVPVTVIGKKVMVGFDEKELLKFL